MHAKRTLAASVAIAAAAALAPAGAVADGLPALGIDVGPAGVTAAGSAVRFVTLPAGRGTLVAQVERDGGQVRRSRVLRGKLTVPAVAYDGSAGGLSADGRTLVLVRPRRAFPQVSTTFAVLSARRVLVRRRITLRGDFSFDALSPDGRTLYLIQYRSPRDPARYAVRAYDLRARRLLPAPITDPREPGERMAGVPVTRATSPDGRWAYTLYAGAGKHAPFVHALDTTRRTAACIDVEAAAADPDVFGLRLTLGGGANGSGGGGGGPAGGEAAAAVSEGRLVVSGRSGPLATIDTTTFRVSAAHAGVARAIATRGAPGRTVPWLGVAIAAALLAATVGAWRHTRSTSPA